MQQRTTHSREGGRLARAEKISKITGAAQPTMVMNAADKMACGRNLSATSLLQTPLPVKTVWNRQARVWTRTFRAPCLKKITHGLSHVGRLGSADDPPAAIES